jgi:hypothetical protein
MEVILGFPTLLLAVEYSYFGEVYSFRETSYTVGGKISYASYLTLCVMTRKGAHIDIHL